ncbi:tryptophan--tRNA ligase [Isoptericola sp. 178]|uniref:tryptophan--tRNA ligase n=1 Tax=Isoptericola sp. 178 TaxID=3064651 RepID=UPI0027131B3C|nr:tryptophan--tRNA ligase [Isoptericola sp. 178]MDO8143286.1 tryptophan--tRNA ligase [Isoptericola sp. 178]
MTAATDTETASVRAARARSAEIEAQITRDPSRFRVLTGDRPTGALHLGHYLATLANRVRLQQAGLDVVLVIADYQVITDRDETGDLPGVVREVVLDYLAAGIDPDRTTIFTHSAVPALHQLMLPFLSLVTVAELERNPTVKSEASDAAGRQGRGMSGLLLTYPVHQAADILAVHGNLVPVGADQLPHLEVSRAVARRFNQRFTAAQPYFAEPDALLTDAVTVLGHDGVKMAKSRGNSLELRASEDDTAAFFRRARTDSERHITFDPETRPEVANLLRIGAHFAGTTPESLAASVGAGGAGRLKQVVTEGVVEGLRPVRARRRALAADGAAVVGDVLRRGNARANVLAEGTLTDVRELMGMRYT